jgi:hypothetical protein
MTVGTRTYEGLAVPLKGESKIKQAQSANDVLTIEGAASQTGDFIVLRTSAGTEKFSVEVDGDVVVAGTGTINGGVSIACNANGDTVSDYGANGAIAVADNVVKLSKATASAMTLAAPGTGNWPKFMTIYTSTAAAHVITVTGLSGGNTLTFADAIGNSCSLKAVSATVWAVAGLNGVTVSTVG